jgi:hypothetical protein
MTRTILATAAALLGAMTLLTPAAEACISCEYVPSVAHSPSPSYGGTHYRVKRVYARAVERSAGPSRKRIVKSEPVKKVNVAKAVDTAPVKSEAPEKADAETENSTISTATLDTAENVVEKASTKEANASPNVGCKKFFPTVGMTLTVPCE